MDDVQKLKNELKRYKEEIDRLQEAYEMSKYWNDKNNVNQLTIRATNQSREIEELKKQLEIAEHFNDLNNVREVTLRATQRGETIKKQEKEIQELKNEIQKLKDENKLLKSNSLGESVKAHNERGAGRKKRFSVQEKEMMKMYRIQGKTIKEIAEMYQCSVGLVHKLINE